MIRILATVIATISAFSSVSCSRQPREQSKPETAPDSAVLEIPIGDQTAVFRKVSPQAYKIDYPDFYLLETEVTNRMYREYLRATGQRKDDTDVLKIVENKSFVETLPDGSTVVGYRSSTHETPYSINDKTMIWRDGEYPDGQDEYPVALLMLDNAQSFCDWLSKTHPDRGLFRLPTWNEWMIAAFGSSRGYPWGNNWDRTIVHTSYGYSWDDRPTRTEPVRSRPQGRTPEGLYGMIGNVSEFQIAGDPTNAAYYVVGARSMGGGFDDGIPSSMLDDKPEELKPRKDYWGYYHDSEGREDHMGFRVLLDVKKDRSLIGRAPVFPEQDNQWRTKTE